MIQAHPSRRSRMIGAGVAATLLAGSATAAMVLAGPASAGLAAPAPASLTKANGFDDDAIGFGTGTTGGAGGTTVTVTTIGQLLTEAKSAGKKVIQIAGVIAVPEADRSNKDIAQVDVTSDKTIIGTSPDASLVGAGLFVKKAHNVIIRNLRISYALAPTDLIQVQKSDHVWVDHNELFNDTTHDKDYYDGMLDINHGSDLITVSWNKLHDHAKGSLVGHSDNNATEDTGHLRVTYHHNWFDAVGSRLPRVRFGTVHAFNNLYEDAKESGIHCLMGAQCLVQNNVFHDVKSPIWTTIPGSRGDGYAVESGNDFGGNAPVITQVGSFSTPPYAFTLNPTATVVDVVKAGAGTLRPEDVQPSASASSSTTASASANPAGSQAASPAAGGSLPVTGAQTALAATAGVALLLVGGGLYRAGRRRRVVAVADEHLDS